MFGDSERNPLQVVLRHLQSVHDQVAGLLVDHFCRQHSLDFIPFVFDRCEVFQERNDRLGTLGADGCFGQLLGVPLRVEITKFLIAKRRGLAARLVRLDVLAVEYIGMK